MYALLHKNDTYWSNPFWQDRPPCTEVEFHCRYFFTFHLKQERTSMHVDTRTKHSFIHIRKMNVCLRCSSATRLNPWYGALCASGRNATLRFLEKEPPGLIKHCTFHCNKLSRQTFSNSTSFDNRNPSAIVTPVLIFRRGPTLTSRIRGWFLRKWRFCVFESK